MVVRVPVLSEQITVVHPSVSTDGRDRTMAFRLAIFFVPRARHLEWEEKRKGETIYSIRQNEMRLLRVSPRDTKDPPYFERMYYQSYILICLVSQQMRWDDGQGASETG